MNKRQAIPFIVLLLAFVLWIFIDPKIQTPSFTEHSPSYVADNVLSSHYDTQGFNDYRIFAMKMTSYPDEDITLFELPKVIVYTKDESTGELTTWQLTSTKGTLENKNKLLLSDNVLVENLTKNQLVQNMITNQAVVMLESKEISTKSKVTWTGPQVRQEGVGMWASMITKEMKLNSNIKAVYINESK